MTSKRSVPRVVLIISAAAFAGFGLAFVAAPTSTAGLVEIGLSTATARTDFRALYGGFELGFGGFLACCVYRGWLGPGLLASGLVLSGAAAVRVGGMLLDGPVVSLLYAALAAESAGAVISFWALRHTEESEAGRSRGAPLSVLRARRV